MRPQLRRHATRAAAAAGAIALAIAVTVTAVTPSVSAAPTRLARHRQGHHIRPQHLPLHLRARLLHPNVLIGGDVAFIGVTSPRTSHRPVSVQALIEGHWSQVARTVTDHDGYFLAKFWPHTLGRIPLRVRAVGIPAQRARVAGSVATVYHQVIASWYSLPGATTACGEQLDAGTLGVANKTLPCGTKVTLRVGSRSITVPVIDRGPYVAGRDYDLTYATKQALDVGGVSLIWASA